MNEKEKALKLANSLLDEPNADPDDDLRLLARHLIRTNEALPKIYDRGYVEGSIGTLKSILDAIGDGKGISTVTLIGFLERIIAHEKYKP